MPTRCRLPSWRWDGSVFWLLHRQIENKTNRLFPQRIQHGPEHVKAFTLVLNQRIALRQGTHSDALFEIVHLIKVLTPFTVYDRQQHMTLHIAHTAIAELAIDLSFAAVVRGECVFQQHLAKMISG